MDRIKIWRHQRIECSRCCHNLTAQQSAALYKSLWAWKLCYQLFHQQKCIQFLTYCLRTDLVNQYWLQYRLYFNKEQGINKSLACLLQLTNIKNMQANNLANDLRCLFFILLAFFACISTTDDSLDWYIMFVFVRWTIWICFVLK